LLTILAFNLIAFVKCRDLSRALSEKDALESERIKVCLEEPLGCFPDTHPQESSKFSDYMELKYHMSSRETVATEFRFWAPGETQATIITNYNFHVHFEGKDSGYNPELKAIFIIHGFHGGDAPWAVIMKDALMKREPSNIFIVDWSGGDGFWYGTARANTWIVAAELGRLIQRIGIITGMTLDKVHIIGQGLGAHAAGYAGKWLRSKVGRKVRRITGLDVAGPDFEDYEVGRRLDRDDAEFVDTIHTNAAYSIKDGFGIVKPVGHFDFYPNGGELQPGCTTAGKALANIALQTYEFIKDPVQKGLTMAAGDKNDVRDAIDGLSCNHGRAYQFFIESVNSTSCRFIGEECNTWLDYLAGKCDQGLHIPMGYDSEQYKGNTISNKSKKFYLSTNENSPFCKQ